MDKLTEALNVWIQLKEWQKTLLIIDSTGQIQIDPQDVIQTPIFKA